MESQSDDLTQLKHVRTSGEAGSRASCPTAPCEDFETFKPLFKEVQEDLNNGVRETRVFEQRRPVAFSLSGDKRLTLQKWERRLTDQGRSDARLRVIFDNGTESNLLMRSLQKALSR